MAVVKLMQMANHNEQERSINSVHDLVKRLTAANIISTPLNVHKVAEFLGLEVEYEIMDDDLSGYLEFKNGRWVIGINTFHHPNRQNFSIAHEIAHYSLHRKRKSSFSDEIFARRTDSNDPMEKEADRFASELLMPEDSVRASIAKGFRSLPELAKRFGVSALAMKYRVQNLGFTVK